jgi:lysophospholipase L1-like esterase
MRKVSLVSFVLLAACSASIAAPAGSSAEQSLVGNPAGSIPAGLPAKLAVGLFEDTGKTWMKSSGIPWDVRYRYFTKGWANNWGYGANDGAWGLEYMQESSASGQIPAIAYYEMNEQPGGWEGDFYAKTKNATTMASYFGDFKLLMQRAKDFGKPVVVLLEADGFAYMQQQSGNNPLAYSAIAASGLPELAGLPNTAAGWGLAFLQLRKSVGADQVILGIHISGWATGADLFHSSVTEPLQPAVDSVYAFLSPMGLAANQTGQTYDVLVGDPLDRDADYYQLVRGENRWWDASDTASIDSKSFNRYAEWLRLWNLKAGKRWVLWQIPVGNSSSLNVCNGGGPRQGYKDNRTEYFFGADGAVHREKFASDGVIALLFGAGEGCQGSFEADLDATGQPYLKTHAGPFLQAGGLTLSGASTPISAPPASTPAPAPGGDSATFNFEGGTQSWKSTGAVAAALASSATQKFAGTHALAVKVAGAGAARIEVADPAIAPGTTVAFHLWIPAAAQLSSVSTFVQEDAVTQWRWTGNWVAASSLARGSWNTINVTVPADASKLQSLGLELAMSGAAQATVYVDSIGGSSTGAAVVVAPAPVTAVPPPANVVPAPAPAPAPAAGTPAPTALGCLKVMPLGDSITLGVNGGYRNTLFSSMVAAGCGLNFVGSQSDQYAQITDKDHEGHPGFTISDIAQSVTGWLTSAQPDYVTLMIGTNDIAWWTAETAAQIADRHAQLVDQILAARPNAWVVVGSIPPITSQIIAPQNIDRAQLGRDFNAAVKVRMAAMEAAGKRVRFADVNSVLTVADLYDGVHPTQAAHARVANAFFAALLPVTSCTGPAVSCGP